MVFFKGKAFPSLALRCSLPLLAGTPRNAPTAKKRDLPQKPWDCHLLSSKKGIFPLYVNQVHFA